MSAAATRAWYLPTCVNCATPVTSPIAHTSSAPAARSRSSTSTPRGDVLTPSSSRPSRSTFGRRPVATSRRSASSVEPSERWSRMPGSTRSIPTPRRTSMPSSRNSSASSSPASEWTRPSRCVAALDDRHLRAHAGEELRELGADRAAAHDDEALRHLVRPRRLAVRPVLDRVEPVDRRDRGPRAGGEDEPVVRQLLPVHLHDARPRDAAFAAHEPAPPLLEVVELAGVVPVARHPVAPRPDARPGPDARRAVPAPGRATRRARSPAASSSSACTRSTSTRRRRAGSRRA